MKTMFYAFGTIVVIALGANLALAQIGFSSKDRTAGPAVSFVNDNPRNELPNR